MAVSLLFLFFFFKYFNFGAAENSTAVPEEPKKKAPPPKPRPSWCVCVSQLTASRAAGGRQSPSEVVDQSVVPEFQLERFTVRVPPQGEGFQGVAGLFPRVSFSLFFFFAFQNGIRKPWIKGSATPVPMFQNPPHVFHNLGLVDLERLQKKNQKQPLPVRQQERPRSHHFKSVPGLR